MAEKKMRAPGCGFMRTGSALLLLDGGISLGTALGLIPIHEIFNADSDPLYFAEVYVFSGLLMLAGILGYILCNRLRAGQFVLVSGAVLVVAAFLFSGIGLLAKGVVIPLLTADLADLIIPALYAYGGQLNAQASKQKRR